MNFRVNLAVAFAAAFSFACADKPDASAIAHVAEGREIGTYRMDISPVAGTNDVVFNIIPIGGDNNPTTNPPGKLQIRGQFRATVSAAGQNGNPCGVPALDASVVVTNFASEALTNVWVRIPSITAGFEGCNSDAGTYPSNMNTSVGGGRWSYGDLSAAPNSLGTSAGGTATKTWWMKYPSAAPKSFFFSAYATIPALPSPITNGTVTPGTALSWTNGAASATRIEVCPVMPQTSGLDDTAYGLCPSGKLTFDNGVGVTTQSTATLSENVQYYWRIGNGPGATLFSTWRDLFILGSPVVAGPANGVSVAANAAAFNLSWTYDLANSFAWGSAIRICSDDPCTVVVAEVAVQQTDPVDGLNTQDFVAIAPPDPAATQVDIPANWILPGTYYWSVAYVDAAPAVNGTFTPGAYTAQRSFTVTAVSPVPAGVAYTSGTTTLSWTTATEVAGTVVMLYDLNPANPLFDATNIVGATAGDLGVAVVGTPGAWELVLPFVPAAATTYWYEVYVADFFAIDLTTQLPFATTLKASGSFTTP